MISCLGIQGGKNGAFLKFVVLLTISTIQSAYCNDYRFFFHCLYLLREMKSDSESIHFLITNIHLELHLQH